MVNTSKLEIKLRQHGKSVTAARRAVYTALHGQEPLTIKDLVLRANNVDKASVYRTVDLFERLGILQRLHTGWKYKLELSDAFHDHHHHATCLGCGRTFVLPEQPKLEDGLQELVHHLSFTIVRHQIELQGYCSSCYKVSGTLI